jgi:hypothetical protein
MKFGAMLGAAFAALLAVCAPAFALENFLYTGNGDLPGLQKILERPDIAGAQVVYSWKALEPSEGTYDFSAIERDLAATGALKKKLFIQIQDRFFDVKARNIPAYLQTGKYAGGLAAQVDNAGEGQPTGYGWVALQWNADLRARYQALLTALAKQFDGRVAGINLPETAIDIDMKRDKTGFSCDAYFDAEMANLAAARAAFTQSHVVQYVNFWPCEWENDHNYMGRLFEYAAQNQIGLGGPDVIPYRKGQMKNAYPFFHQMKGKLALVAMAVQEPTLTYKNPKTGKRFTRAELVDFAQDYLGADIVFWSSQSPWLKE